MRKVENQNKEFKQTWNENSLKTICVFANLSGGKLYTGIDDDGKEVGVKRATRYLDDIPNKTKDVLGITPDVKIKKKAGKDIDVTAVKNFQKLAAKKIPQIAKEKSIPAILQKWHLSRPRNKYLADAFFKAGMIESWGRGTIKIIDECRKAGLPEPELREEFGGLSVHFRKVPLGETWGEKVGENGEKISAGVK